MSDDPYQAPDNESWRSKLVDKPARFDLSTALWFALAAVATLPIVLSAVPGNRGTDVRFAMFGAGAVLLLSCTIALKLKWGPVIPCVVLFPTCGIMSWPVLNPSPADLIFMLLFYVFLGGIIGFVLEVSQNKSTHNHSRSNEADPG